MDQLKEQSAHEGHCAMAQNSPRFTYREMVEGGDLKTPMLPRLLGLISLHRFVLNHLQKSQR